MADVVADEVRPGGVGHVDGGVPVDEPRIAQERLDRRAAEAQDLPVAGRPPLGAEADPEHDEDEHGEGHEHSRPRRAGPVGVGVAGGARLRADLGQHEPGTPTDEHVAG